MGWKPSFAFPASTSVGNKHLRKEVDDTTEVKSRFIEVYIVTRSVYNVLCSTPTLPPRSERLCRVAGLLYLPLPICTV